MRRLDFRDPEQACSALEEGLQIHWDDKQAMVDSKQSDLPENPVEVVEVEEKFTKSSLKDIGTLFSSFDEWFDAHVQLLILHTDLNLDKMMDK